MKKHLDFIEAWDDFWLWIKADEERWKSIPRKGRYGKLYLYKTAVNVRKRGEPGRPVVGAANIQHILEHHAPERYKMESHFVLHGKPMPKPKPKNHTS